MTYEIYRYIFIVAAILCGTMTITAVILFVLLKIPKVIGDLTGRTAKKAIENIRNQNESADIKGNKNFFVDKERKKATGKISSQKSGQSNITLPDSNNKTAILSESAKETGKTTLLNRKKVEESTFKILYDITFIHTDEIIHVEVD